MNVINYRKISRYLWLAVTCAGLAGSPVVAQGPVTLIDQNFDNKAVFTVNSGIKITGVGSAASVEGFWRSNSPASMPTVKADPAGGANDQAIEVVRTGPSTNSLIAERLQSAAIASGAFTAQASLYRSSAQSALVFNLQSSAEILSKFPIAVFIQEDGTLAVRNGVGSAWEKTAVTIPPATWAALRLEVDMEAAQWSLYAAVGKAAEQAVFTGRSFNKADLPLVNTLMFIPQAPENSSFWVDDVKLVQTKGGVVTAASTTASNIAPPADPAAQLLAIPEYVPDLKSDDPQVVAYRHKEINVREFGAVADGNSHPLREKFGTQAEVDAKYGAGRYTLDDEADYVAIMEAIRISKAGAEYLPVEKMVRYTSTIFLPSGRYVVNRTIPLTDTYGGTIRGEGRQQTAIRINAPMPLFGITRCSFLTFQNFSIESKLASRSTGFYILNDDRSSKPTFQLMFDSLIYQFLYKAIHIAGNKMTDSMVFSNSRFLRCLTSFHLQNPQGLNYQFIGCSFESHGSAELYAPYRPSDTAVFRIEAGGAISVYGGSIVSPGTTLLLAPDIAFSPDGGVSPPINVGSGIYNFYGVRWEQTNSEKPILFDAVSDGRFQARINYDNCMVYQHNAVRGKAVAALWPGMNVTLRNSVFNGSVIEEKIEPGQEKRRAVLILDNSSGVTYQQAKGDAPYHHLVEQRGVAIKP